MNMVYPRADFRSSYSFVKHILGDISGYHETEMFLDDFKCLFKKHERTIMTGIERYTGFKWGKDWDIIPVWVINSHHPSISFPLLLNTKSRNQEFTMFVLIHELVHNILFSRLEIKWMRNDDQSCELESIVELVTKYVGKTIFEDRLLKKMCKLSEYGGTRRRIWDKERILEEKWDLEKMPLAFWLENDKKYIIK